MLLDITALESDKEVLEEMGIIVGEYNKDNGEFVYCYVDDFAMDCLDKLWGHYYWSES
jgi:hypothetical protein